MFLKNLFLSLKAIITMPIQNRNMYMEIIQTDLVKLG